MCFNMPLFVLFLWNIYLFCFCDFLANMSCYKLICKIPLSFSTWVNKVPLSVYLFLFILNTPETNVNDTTLYTLFAWSLP